MAGSLWRTAEGQAVVVLVALLASSVSLLLLLLHCRHRHRWRGLNLPPAPFPRLPLLGNLLHVHRLLQSRSHQTLGPIFSLDLGTSPVIVVTSAALAHEALVTQGRLFSDRPLVPSRSLFTSNFRNINAAPYGAHWRTMRRNLVQEMLSMPKILSFRPARVQALTRLVSTIRLQAASNQGVVSVHPILRGAMFELLLFMCFGYRMAEEEILQMSELLDDVVKTAAGQLLDFFPFLKVFRPRKRVAERMLRARQVQVFTSHFVKHKELKGLGQLAPGSYLETLLRMDVSTDEMVTLCSEFMVAGTDTTVTTLEWAMAHIIRKPAIQFKLYNQIHDAIGNRLVEEGDLQHLPYLQAVIKETLRLHPPGHFLLPHAVSIPHKLGGYDIPPGASIFFNVISISQDPAIWEEPLHFQPERFLVSDVDITGSKEVTMIPFGAGRRICPGLGLATMHMEMFIAHLVQAFEWTSWPPKEAVDLSEMLHFTVRMKRTLRALVQERRWSSSVVS